MAYQHTSWLLLLSAALVISDVTASIASNDTSAYLAERRLRQTLLNNGEYDAKERPVILSNQPVDVDLSLTMYALVSLDEKEQVLKGASWLIMQWYDYRIYWNPDRYGNLSVLSLGMDEIWTPKILLTNTASEKLENPIQENAFRALASCDGAVLLEGPIIHVTSCEMELSQFPFDNQNCYLSFATQNMPNSIVNLIDGPYTGLLMHETTSQWKALEFTGEVVAKTFESRNYSKVTFKLAVKRLPYHYLLNIALPSAILTLISLGVFWLRPESGERISMAVSLLLGQAVFWLVTTESLPPSGNGGVPLLMKCIECNFVVGGLAILLSVVTVGLQYQRGPLRGRCLRKLFLQLLPLPVCIRPPDDRGKIASSAEGKEEQPSMGSPDTVELASAGGECCGVDKPKESNAGTSPNGLDDMKLVATILDRLFFVIATIIFICGNIQLIAECLEYP